MHRREFIAAAGTAAAVMAAAGEALADTDPKAAGDAAAPGAPAAHAGHGHDSTRGATGGSKYEDLAESAAECVATGNDCLRHCLDSFVAGDTTLAACAKTVRDVISACAALETLALSNSPHVPAFAKAVLGVCMACEQECRKHAHHHAECKDCAEACKDCAEECKALGA
jgi:Cys-rich four helix bundle protein (predicted Tat secretion target)